MNISFMFVTYKKNKPFAQTFRGENALGCKNTMFIQQIDRNLRNLTILDLPSAYFTELSTWYDAYICINAN